MVHKNNRYIFCGGGSGGHVIPAINVIQELRKQNPQVEIEYIGSKEGIESELIPLENISYHGISSGKLRRYFSWQNFLDILNVMYGVLECLKIISSSNKKTIVTSFGGFVSVPPVFAAWILKKKILIHEQTTKVGLANKINSYFADRVMISFESSAKNFPTKKVVFTGYPVRENCLNKKIDEQQILPYLGKEQCHQKVLFVTGGGNGSKLINQLIFDNLDVLKKNYYIIHQVGKQFFETYKPYEDECYKVFGFIGPEIIDLFKVSDIIISRSGAGTVSELLAIGKRSIFIPLKIAQKNEQFYNALVAKEKLGSLIIDEDDLNEEILMNGIHQLQTECRECYSTAIDGTSNIVKELEKI